MVLVRNPLGVVSLKVHASRQSGSIDVLPVANAFMQTVDNATQKPACSCHPVGLWENPEGAIPEKSSSWAFGNHPRVLGNQGTSLWLPGLCSQS